MELSKIEYEKLEIIQKRLANNSAAPNEVKRFIDLMKKKWQ